MGIVSRFPRELLNKSYEERRAYFKLFMVAHPKLVKAEKQILNIIQEPADAGVIFLVGPTGIGKTTLQKQVIKRLIEKEMSSLKKNPGRIVAARMLAPNPYKRPYSWPDHFIRTLIALKDVLVENKINHIGLDSEQHYWERVTRSLRSVPIADRRALESAFRHRNPLAFFIDEAQHIIKVGSGQRLVDQADTIKSLADACQVLHILVGTYDLLLLNNLNGQLARRSVDIHFSRYKRDDPTDHESFMKTLKTLLAHMPLVIPPKMEDEDLFFTRSMGCIGILKNWLSRALAAALDDNQDTVSHKMFEKTALPIAKCKEIAKEIYEGESALEEGEDAESLKELREYLKGKSSSKPLSPSPPKERRENPLSEASGRGIDESLNSQEMAGSKKKEHKAKNAKKSRRTRIGRNPKRDKIGVNSLVGE